MSVLIKGMEKPEHCGYCRFRYDGICHAIQKTQYSMDECPLVGIDDVLDTNVGDIISRQDAIDAINHICPVDTEYDCALLDRVDVRYVLSNMPSAQPEIKPIEYRDCANAMLVMWMDNVVTDGEYNRIMDKLNAYWRVDVG